MNTVRVRCNPCWVLEDGTPATGAPHLARCLHCYAAGGTDAILSERIDELCLLLGRAVLARQRVLDLWAADPMAIAVPALRESEEAVSALIALALAEPP